MSTLVFYDRDVKIPVDAPQPQAIRIRGLRRQHELHLIEQFEIDRAQIARVTHEAALMTAQLGRALPPHLQFSPSHDQPSFWDCYSELFRSWSVAPLLANALIARRAAREYAPDRVHVVEDAAASDWWSFRPQLYEAVRQGLLGTGIQPSARPGAFLRMLRTLAGPWMAALGEAAAQLSAAATRERGKWMRSLPLPGRADLLFLAVGPTTVPIIDRISSFIRTEFDMSAAALMSNPHDVGMEQSSRTDVPFQYIDNFHPDSPLGSSQLLRRSLALLSWPSWLWYVCQQVQPVHFGRLWPAVRDRLAVALAKDSPQMRADITAARRILDQYRPAAIVAFHLYWYRTAPIVLAARARGIPVIYLQHGIYLAKDDCIRPLPFDEYLVFGEGAAEPLHPRVPEGAISVVGHCLYDELIADLRATGHRANAEDRASAGRILLATQPDETALFDVQKDDWWITKVAEACRELRVRLLIKLHPGDAEVTMYYRLADDMPQVISMVEHGTRDLTDLIADSDCLVTRDSTVVLQANLLGVPAVVVNVTGRRDRFPFVRDGGAVGAYRTEDILPVLRRVLGSPSEHAAESRTRFLRRHLGPLDGRATHRAGRIIAQYAFAGRDR